MDISDFKNKLRYIPSQESMEMFSTTEHMAKFGRPLWSAYKSPEGIAAAKLVGGGQIKLMIQATLIMFL